MTPPGRLHLLGVHAPPVLLFLGLLLLAPPPGAQGLPRTDRSSDPCPHQASFSGTFKPTAHLIGDSLIPNVLSWTAATDHTFLHGFSLNNNSLVVPSTGVYFIYSQVLFSGNGCPNDDIPLFLTHEVQLFSSQYPTHMSILSAQTSLCPGMEGPWMRSLYVGAVFLLNQGDKLSTQTHGISHLALRPSGVFFGAFAL
ncbi:lymphotoxin-alpha [Perognathus longimembris pacificus]|uniref:lymphotoxin-alpha n=1 Tax=Perognathus longimembris pacificus TaxID=214514 RepID=UPI0020193E7D|nr:lymphotoxin-alpha [Perognathus longimembris pacificus]